MDDIKGWLSKKPYDYDKGIQIYLRYNPDPLFIALFKEQETPFKREKLIELMKGMSETNAAEIQPENAQPVLPSPAPMPSLPLGFKGWPNPMDSVLLSLFNQGQPLYVLMMNLQARIYDVALQGEQGNLLKEQEAGKMAHRILDISAELDEIYAQRDHYLHHGQLPATATKNVDIVDPVRWATALANAQRYIREYRIKIQKNPGHKKLPQWEQKIRDFEADVAKYSKLLKLN